MDKAALMSFAAFARKDCQNRVEAKVLKLGISEDALHSGQLKNSDEIFIHGKQLGKDEQRARDQLIVRMKQSSYGQVIAEVAYTWFNRFIALRFMEVNDYLPTKTRVLSSLQAGSSEPDMMKEALSLPLEMDKAYVYELIMAQDRETLFKYLTLQHCHDLHRYMPFMFETVHDETDLLFPEGLLTNDSFIAVMTNTELIPEKSWEKIEMIGWLYQYYIAEEKDRVFKKKAKYTKTEIPYATQLFTPEWIVRYMVQNSLGRYWIETHPGHAELTAAWELYFKNMKSDTAPIIAIEKLTCFDPAMGSGHILVYMFDVLYEIYRKCGYVEREIPRLIIENNLYGLDIDHRAYQLACFSVVMKALAYDRRFLRSIKRKSLKLHLAAIQETNHWTDEEIAYLAGEKAGENFSQTKAFITQFRDAKTIGSLLKVTNYPEDFLQKRLVTITKTPPANFFDMMKRDKVLTELPNLLKQAHIMKQAYDVLVTNPPYMSARSMNQTLREFLKTNYPDSKADLFAAFMEIDHYVKAGGFYACINQHSWMFLSSFEKLRKKVIRNKQIVHMLHLGPRAFAEIGGEVVQSTAFVLRNQSVSEEQRGGYVRLVEARSANDKQQAATEAAQGGIDVNEYIVHQNNFHNIPGSPIAYWTSERTGKIFTCNKKLIDIAEPKQGLATANNDRFLRFWYEIDFERIGFGCRHATDAIQSEKKWFPYNKGGSFRKWYGNQEYVVNWENDGEEIKNFVNDKGKQRSRPQNTSYYFKESITWSFVSTAPFGVRYSPPGFIFDVGGSSLFPQEKDMTFLIGLLSSKLAQFFLASLNPTLNFQVGNIGSIPLPEYEKESIQVKEVERLTNECIAIAKKDWDAFETSWEFEAHPLLKHKGDATLIADAYTRWERFTNRQFLQLKKHEESLNELFIDMYGLQAELTSEVADKEITIRKADKEREIKSLLSFAIGCAFGRYSLDEPGLVLAGGRLNREHYRSFQVDEDNILPILPGAYFADDLVSKVVAFIRVVFGEEDLEKNLDFIANRLNRRTGETAKETIRRYFLTEFYRDHVQIYKKRPIYWLFTSGKERAFNCLIYIHRYDRTTLSRIRTDYLHEYQNRLEVERSDLQLIITANKSTKETNMAKRALKSVEKKIAELEKYDELLHHMADRYIDINLDDGIKANMEKFKGLLAKI